MGSWARGEFGRSMPIPASLPVIFSATPVLPTQEDGESS